MSRLGGQSAFDCAVTIASATSAFACFAPAYTGVRLPDAAGRTFAHEVEGCRSMQGRGSSRSTTTARKEEKRNNSGQSAAPNSQSSVLNSPFLAFGFQLNRSAFDGDTDQDADTPNASTQAVSGSNTVTEEIPLTSPAAGPQGTAFAMRMQAPATTSDAAQDELSGIGAGAIDKRIPDPEDQPASTQQALPAVFQLASRLAPEGATRATGATQQSPDVQARHPLEMPKAVDPLNRISIQVGQSANEKVVVRLVQQGGELRLAVRTDNADLARGLQQSLPDLVGKLQENGYRTEAWKPAQAPTTAPATAETKNASNHSGQGDAQSQAGGSQQDGRHQQNNPSNRPRWVAELENRLADKDQSTGGLHGFSS